MQRYKREFRFQSAQNFPLDKMKIIGVLINYVCEQCATKY
jgi:hypothetical protein